MFWRRARGVYYDCAPHGRGSCRLAASRDRDRGLAVAVADLVKLDAQIAPFAALVDRIAPGDPALAQLRASRDALRPFLDGSGPDRTPAEADAVHHKFLADLKTFVDTWRRELVRELLGPLPELPAIRDVLANTDWLNPDGISTQASLGPLTLRAGLAPVMIPADVVLKTGTLQPPLPPLGLGPSRIDRVGASLAGPLPGDGMLRVLDDGVSGALRLPLGPVTVDALASLRRLPSGGPSFLAILGVEFTPSIQLSFGFALDRVGGIVGIERGLDLDALTRGIRSGTATATLFGAPGSDPSRRLVGAEALFPPQAGHHVVGPMLGLAWLSAGAGTSLVHADVAVLIQLGGPITIAIVGKAKLELSELLRMQVDVAGSIDAARGRVAADISIVEARVLGAFRLTGDAAFRATTGDGGGVVFSAGGFYPGFDPKPIEIGPLRRLGFGTDLPTPGLDIRVEGYFAATSNTMQLGGRLDVVFDAALVVAKGSLGLDAMAQLRPFHFHANVDGGVEVEFLGETFCGVHVSAEVDGPGPMSVSARLTIETFLKDIPWHETFTFGDGAPDRAGRATSLRHEVWQHANDPGVLRASAPDDPAVVLAPQPGPGVVLAPLGELIWAQRLTPLGVLCDRLQSEPLAPAGQKVTAAVAAPATSKGDVREPFAPGAYLNLPPNVALMVPAFDPQIAGLRIGFDRKPAPTVDQPKATDVILIRPNQLPLTTRHKEPLSTAWARAMSDAGLAAPKVWDETARCTRQPETWHTADGAPHDTPVAAWQHARHGAGGVPVHATDPVLDTGGL